MLKPSRPPRIARFYHADALVADSELSLSRQASHHLVTVLRTRQGDVIELFNGDGYNYRATLLDTGQRKSGKCALLQVHAAYRAHTESSLPVTLIQAISRGDRMDATLRQSVELGVHCIQPIYTRHSVKPLDEKRIVKKQEHWHSIVISACEQSGRASIPTLAEPLALDDLLQQWAPESQRAQTRSAISFYVLSPIARHSLVDRLKSASSDSEVAVPGIGLIIGPESGLEADEIQQAVNAGAQAVRIGPRILRTETAGPACMAVVQAILGDLG